MDGWTDRLELYIRPLLWNMFQLDVVFQASTQGLLSSSLIYSPIAPHVCLNMLREKEARKQEQTLAKAQARPSSDEYSEWTHRRWVLHFLLTPHSSLLTPHSSLLTPHSSLLTPHSSLLTPPPPHFSLLSHFSLTSPHSHFSSLSLLLLLTSPPSHFSSLSLLLTLSLLPSHSSSLSLLRLTPPPNHLSHSSSACFLFFLCSCSISFALSLFFSSSFVFILPMSVVILPVFCISCFSGTLLLCIFLF